MGDASTRTADAGARDRFARRRAAGVFFTPPAVVRHIVHHTLGPLLEARQDERPLQILEPSCGEGVFLAEAFRYLRNRRLDARIRAAATQGTVGAPADLVQDVEGKWQLPADEQRQLLLSSCFGLDIDPALVATARGRLARLVTGAAAAKTESLQRELSGNIRCADALLGPDFPQVSNAEGSDQPVDWKRDFARAWPTSDGGFDAVIGNPPYVNIRRLTISRGPAIKHYLREHYQCARGAFDLYVLFLELAFRVLRPGGVCGMIVPNKLACLTYAAPCRALLLAQTSIESVIDLSRWRVFPEAGVYPYVVIWRKQAPAVGHQIAVSQAASEAELTIGQFPRDVAQSSLSAAVGWHLHGALDVESRVTTRPLGTFARLHSGTTGFLAATVADAIQGESTSPGEIAGGRDFRFIVSGNIDRYLIRWGQARFMKRTFFQPILPSAWAKLTDAKRALFEGPKIVIAGMTRRIEAAWDSGGLALGVQVFAVAELKEDRRYLLGLLNSKLFSFIFRTRFRAKQLAGGFMAVNKGQLDQLPIRVIAPEDEAAALLRQRLVRCVEPLERLTNRLGGASAPSAVWQGRLGELERQIDQCVYQLYGVTADEIARIEADVPP